MIRLKRLSFFRLFCLTGRVLSLAHLLVFPVLLAGLLLASQGCSPDEKSRRPAGGAAGRPSLKDVPRNRTVILDCPDSGVGSGQYSDYDSFNPFIPGGISRTGYNYLYEPLYFYNVYRDELIPWIATGHEFTADYTEVTVKIREGVEWSDGSPWTARDLVFTINMLKRHAPRLMYSVDMDTHVESAVALDDGTARIALTAPNPRFVFTYFTSYFCSGIPIVPEHVWRGRDPTTFRNLDLARGWPVVTGPYRMALSVPEQKVYDLRRDWWAAKTGFRRLPRVERIIYLTYMGDPARVQNLIANRIDSSLGLRPANTKVLLEKNPNVTTWTGRKPPYGYLDHWPVCLGFNDLEEPFSDPEFRRAVSLAIDREQIVEVGLAGAGASTLVPFPEFPPMRRFVDAARSGRQHGPDDPARSGRQHGPDDAAGGLFTKYRHGEHDPARAARIMESKGWARDSGGFWARGGQRAKIVIEGFVFVFQDFAPVLVEQLRRAGFDAAFRERTDCYSRMCAGEAKAFLCGTSASVRDPYATLSRYHGRYVRPTGTATPTFWRWRNEAFDELIDEMARHPADDPRFMELYLRAMDIWLSELPSIPLIGWHQRVPHNTTYWKGWPSVENPYSNSAYWHRIWLLVLLELEPTGPRRPGDVVDPTGQRNP